MTCSSVICSNWNVVSACGIMGSGGHCRLVAGAAYVEKWVFKLVCNQRGGSDSTGTDCEV